MALLAMTWTLGLESSVQAMDLAQTPASSNAIDQNSDRIEVDLRRYFAGDLILDLRYWIGLTHDYRGREIEAVVVTAMSEYGHGIAQLGVNGWAVGPIERIPSMVVETVFHPQPGYNRIDDTVRSLQLRINGRFFIEKLAVILRPIGAQPEPTPEPTPTPTPTPVPPPPSSPVIEIDVPVRQVFDGDLSLDLRQWLSLDQRYSGRSVQIVCVRGVAFGAPVSLWLETNGTQNGHLEWIDRNPQNRCLSLWSRKILDQDIQQLHLRLRGSLHIESISTVLN